MNIKNVLLLCMLLSYSFPICYIYLKYLDNKSVSSIICNEDNKNKILAFMIIMGIFTILYEMKRHDPISLSVIVLLLLGIYGSINVNEKNKFHYLFATIGFLSIIVFMIHHSRKIKNNVLALSLYIQFMLLFATIIYFGKKAFFTVEVFYILNFAIYYLYLHKLRLKI